MVRIVIYTDGAARGNPGPSASGYDIYRDGAEATRGVKYNGMATNNFAEYNAVILALGWCIRNMKDHGKCDVELYSDSELVVKQLNGRYKVKSAAMKPLHFEAESLASRFGSIEFRNLPREDQHIKEVDARLNRLLDRIGH
ncbi:ribonuclease HI family protein [Candidatus Marsarchaeota archaeon]|jgi:ribonuclease HI|nr:ribonuclease HI family protein [Candidatus Marsarchaeota archaeon]MCL5115411.1 ribonuclease HI family protein [Candidatus Marsarchaeota archaeon]